MVKQTKYLGTYLDEHLPWNIQISQIKSKLSRCSGVLAKLRYCVKPDLLRTVILQFLIQFSDTEFKFGDKIGTNQ